MSHGIQSFTLTREHLTLARGLLVDWASFRGEPDEHGIPQFNAKRPYGNSYVAGDIIEALGWDYPDEDDESLDGGPELKRVEAMAWAIHREMEVVVEILMQHAGSIALPGVYENLAASEWSRPVWHRTDEQAVDLSHLDPATRAALIQAFASGDLPETTVACERERLRQGEAGIERRLLGRDPADVAMLADLMTAANNRAKARKTRITALERRLAAMISRVGSSSDRGGA